MPDSAGKLLRSDVVDCSLSPFRSDLAQTDALAGKRLSFDRTALYRAAVPDLHATPGKKPIIRIENGQVRVLSHDLATEMVTYLEFPERLTILQQQFFCGALLHRRYIDEPLASHEYAQLIKASDIPINQVPDQKIVKMMKAEHADAMLKRGALRLGSIDYYRKYDNADIGDSTEGICVLSAFDGVKTAIAEVRGGLNDFLFCTFRGDMDPDVVRRMGYDATVEITDVPAFSAAIARKLRSRSSRFSICIYVRDRAIYGDAAMIVERQHFMDGPIAEMLGEARAFLKPETYAHQCEFRFSWTMRTPTDKYS